MKQPLDELVMRSVYLPSSADSKLRELAFRLNVTKSDLVRSAIEEKLQDWAKLSNDPGQILKKLNLGPRGVRAR